MDTRQKIVQSAYQTFYQRGFHACGVELLAQMANVTKRTLYSHFGSKDGLIAAVLEYRHTQFTAALVSSLDKRPESQTVEAYLQFIIDWTRQPDFHGCLFINVCAEFPTDSPAVRQSAAHKRHIRELLLDRLKIAGVNNPQLQADRVFLLGEGLITAAQTGQVDLIDTFQPPAEWLI